MWAPISAAGKSLCYRCADYDWSIQLGDKLQDSRWEHLCKSPWRCTPGDHVTICRGYAMIAALAMLKGLWNPAVLVLGLALFGGGLATGSHLARQAAKAERLDAVQRAIDQGEELARQDGEILATAAVKRAARQVYTKQLDQEIEKNVEANPAYRECGLDADGLRIWNAANAGLEAELPRQRRYGLPADTLRDIGKPSGANEKPQANDGSIPRLQSPLPGSAGTLQQPKEQP